MESVKGLVDCFSTIRNTHLKGHASGSTNVVRVPTEFEGRALFMAPKWLLPSQAEIASDAAKILVLAFVFNPVLKLRPGRSGFSTSVLMPVIFQRRSCTGFSVPFDFRAFSRKQENSSTLRQHSGIAMLRTMTSKNPRSMKMLRRIVLIVWITMFCWIRFISLVFEQRSGCLEQGKLGIVSSILSTWFLKRTVNIG